MHVALRGEPADHLCVLLCALVCARVCVCVCVCVCVLLKYKVLIPALSDTEPPL